MGTSLRALMSKLEGPLGAAITICIWRFRTTGFSSAACRGRCSFNYFPFNWPGSHACLEPMSRVFVPGCTGKINGQQWDGPRGRGDRDLTKGQGWGGPPPSLAAPDRRPGDMARHRNAQAAASLRGLTAA